jgi:hypothetical protein
MGGDSDRPSARRRLRPEVKAPLATQLKELQKKWLLQDGTRHTQSSLAATLQTSTSTIRRVLGQMSDDHRPTLLPTLAVASVLGLRADYAAIAFARDLVRSALDQLGKGTQELRRIYGGIHASLAKAVPFLYPFATGPRDERSLLMHEIARTLPGHESDDPRCPPTLGLIAETPATDDVWPQVIEVKNGRFESFCERRAGRVSVEASETVFGAMNVHVLSARVDDAPVHGAPLSRSRVRVIRAARQGFRLVVVTHGAVLVSVHHDVPTETYGAPVELPTDTLCKAAYGSGDVFTMEAGRVCRLEFLASVNRVVFFDLHRSLLLHDKVEEP